MIFIVNIPPIIEYKEIEYSNIKELDYIIINNNTSINLINNTREELGLSTVVRTAVLDVSAKNKCQHMYEHNYWAHSGGGKDWWDFLEESGARHWRGGEILGKNYAGDYNSLHIAWLNSPGHYAVIATDYYTRIGIAECPNGDGSMTSVVHFD